MAMRAQDGKKRQRGEDALAGGSVAEPVAKKARVAKRKDPGPDVEHLLVDTAFKHKVLDLLEEQGWKIQSKGANQSKGFKNKTVEDWHTYSGKRIKEICRWVSSTVFVGLTSAGLDKNDDIEEIQATVWPPDDVAEAKFYISANKKAARERMEELFGAGSAEDVLMEMAILAGRSPLSDEQVGQLGIGPRAVDHPQQLAAWLKDRKPKGDPEDPAWEILSQAVTRKAVVASGTPRPDLDTHAEVRLHETITAEEKKKDPAREVRFNPKNVGGLKRPCVFCYLALYADQHKEAVHPGLLWLSDNAALIHMGRFGKSPEEVAAYIVARVQTTYVSPSGHGEDTLSSAEDERRTERELRRKRSLAALKKETARKSRATTAWTKSIKKKAAAMTDDPVERARILKRAQKERKAELAKEMRARRAALAETWRERKAELAEEQKARVASKMPTDEEAEDADDEKEGLVIDG